MTRYAVALGSNLGDRLGHLRSAVEEIGGFASDLEVSHLYETAPVGGPDQDPYLNAVVSFRSDLQPIDLLNRMHQIEQASGRVRDVRWGPRQLDLDIIVSDDGPFEQGTELIIPHPRASERRFVVQPMLDVWPDAEIAPGVCFSDVYPSVSDQEVDVLATNWAEPATVPPGRWLVAIQIVLFLVIGVLIVVDGTLATGALGRYAGLALAGAGVLLMLAAASALGTSLSILPEPVTDGALVEFGPFRWMRHPIYSGVLLVFGGVSLAVGAKWALGATALLAVFFYFKAGYEERQLRARYPQYRAYMREVRYRFFPFLV